MSLDGAEAMKSCLYTPGLAWSLTQLHGLFTNAALTLVLLSLGCVKIADDGKKGPAPGTHLANTDVASSIWEQQKSATPLPGS